MNIKKHIRLIAGIVSLLIGIAFFIVPVIPVLGVAGLFAGAFLLAPYIPILDRFKEWMKKKDSSGNTEKTEKKMNELEEKYGEEDQDQNEGSTGHAQNNTHQSEQKTEEDSKGMNDGQDEVQRSDSTDEIGPKEQGRPQPYEKKEKER